jgi:hypothetical protein
MKSVKDMRVNQVNLEQMFEVEAIFKKFIAAGLIELDPSGSRWVLTAKGNAVHAKTTAKPG